MRPRSTQELVHRALQVALEHLNQHLPKADRLLISAFPDTDASLPALLDACRDTDVPVVVLLTRPESAVGAQVREALGA